MDTLLGKFFIRPTSVKGKNKEKLAIICGVFIVPDGMNIDDRDEMWASKLHVDPGTIKYVNRDMLQISPEDFLANHINCQNTALWERKSE